MVDRPFCCGSRGHSCARILHPSMLRSLPGEDEAGMLRRLLSHLEDTRSAEGRSDSSAPAPAQAVALLQRLSSLVQAGLPMAKRGTFWRLFLNVDAKRQEGEYARLVAEVQALEQRLHAVASPAGAAPSPLGTGKAAAAERSYQQQGLCASAAPGAVTLFADASSAAATAAGPAPPLAYPARISTFSVVPLHEEDSSPDATPIKPSSVANAARLPLVTPAALTPASTLLTPLSDSSHESGGPGCAPPSAASQAAVAERWQQQDYLAQIDKDLVGGWVVLPLVWLLSTRLKGQFRNLPGVAARLPAVPVTLPACMWTRHGGPTLCGL